MLFGEYDYETDIREKQQESYEEGYSSGISKGISQGAARQKAEDEKIFALKDSENAQQAEEIQRLLAKNAELEAMLANK